MNKWAPEPIDLPELPGTVKKFNPASALKEDLIDVMIPVTKPPACLVIRQNQRDITICSLGDISVVGGKAKSRKTVLSSIFTAASVKNSDMCDIVWGELPEDRRGVLYFDTEQSDYHAQKAIKRSLKMAGTENPPFFKAYKLRCRKIEERVQMVEYAINNTPGVGFVIIDGIRDLVNDVNDARECNLLITKLMDWSADKFCHIMNVLHENPGSDKLRGHLGTEITAKAETVFRVEKITNDDNASKVEAAFTRNMPFEPFAIGFNDEDEPTIFHGYEFQESTKKGGGKFSREVKKDISDYSPSEHTEYLSKIFSLGQKLSYSALEKEISIFYPGIKVLSARQAPGFLIEEGWLEKTAADKDKKTRFYTPSDRLKTEISIL